MPKNTNDDIPSSKLTIGRSLLVGALGFSLVSLLVFSTVAFGEGWMYRILGVYGAYIVWTMLFILLGGAVFGSLGIKRWRLPKFYLLFGLAFLAYAAGWVGAYFVLRGTMGEWVGSFAGSVLMAIVLAVGYGAASLILKSSALLFATNSLGYFLGSAIYEVLGRPVGMMLWGVVYGFFLGAGIAIVLYSLQPRVQIKND